MSVYIATLRSRLYVNELQGHSTNGITESMDMLRHFLSVNNA